MGRCLNVLRESAQQMFKGKQQNVLDINYYKDSDDNASDSDNEELIILSKQRKRPLNRNADVIDLSDKQDDNLVDDL